MLFRLVRPVKRSGSSVPQFVQRIPADVLPLAVGRSITVPVGDRTLAIRITPRMNSVRFSLRTTDPAEARARQARAIAALEATWKGLRDARPVCLSHRDATALAGELYEGWSDESRVRTTAVVQDRSGGDWRPERVTPEEHVAIYASIQPHLAAADDAGMEEALGSLVDRLLLAKGIAAVDPETRPVLLHAFCHALRDAMERREREASGDYTPDPNANRFPEWRGPQAETAGLPNGGQKVSLTGVLEEWWKEARAAGRKPSTYESYRNTVTNLAAFLKHDDPSRITPGDVVRFKDHRLASGVSAKTVKDSDLAGLKTVFGWAVANHKLRTNPAAGLTIKLGKKRRVRPQGFTDEEARAILMLSSTYAGSAVERPRTSAAKRWVPWLQAYTGARVGELGQMRKEDLRRVGELWVIRITPEAGTVKTDEARDVVLHPHVVEMGFPEFVQASAPGHLFLKPSRDGDVLGPLQGLKNRLAEFAREVVPDRNVAPNHGWRHRFKTVGLESGIPQRVLDAIQGHAPRTEGEGYGDVTLRTVADAVARLPRYEVP